MKIGYLLAFALVLFITSLGIMFHNFSFADMDKTLSSSPLLAVKTPSGLRLDFTTPVDAQSAKLNQTRCNPKIACCQK